jgi:hypothetical protein
MALKQLILLATLLGSLNGLALDSTSQKKEVLTAPQINNAPTLTSVQGFLIAKVVYSNFVTLRPGSIYEMRYHFEENAGFPRPTFNYMFSDTGLGAAEPLYPMFESGYQGGYAQLIQTANDKKRHLDHFSDMTTPDGCRVQSVYIVRSIEEYPDLYKEERKQGYKIVDVSWDYTTKLRPDAQCGHHRANNPDPSFDPIATMKPYLKNFKSMDQIPAKLLKKYEAKINLEKELEENLSWVLNKKPWKSYAQEYSMEANSLWYYPKGHGEDFGLQLKAQAELPNLSRPHHFILPASLAVSRALPLSQTASAADFNMYLDFLRGQPTKDFNAANEPGQDAFNLNQISTDNMLTSGLKVIRVTDPKAVRELVMNPANYRLVSAVVRPAETEMDPHFPSGDVTIPELRLVYQLFDSRDPNRVYDQAFVHLLYETADRNADPQTRAAQSREFLSELDRLSETRSQHPEQVEEATVSFVKNVIAGRPVQALAFSSSLTGIWVFGRAVRVNGNLVAERQVRHGIDLGYYSTAYDNQIFRDADKVAQGSRKKELDSVLTALTPVFYRDPRRNDVNAITFNSMSCAQCHQMSGRDGVHLRLNDGLDRRALGPVIASEYLYHEINRQWLETAKPE